MEDGNITSLANELDVSEEIALKAVNEADGEIDKARKIIREMMPRHLFIKVRFNAQRQEQAGLIFFLVEKGRPDFILFRAIAEKDVDWIKGHSVMVPPLDFFNAIRRYFTERSTGVNLFDSQQLRTAISNKFSAASVQYLFSLWDQPKTEIQPDTPPDRAFQQVGTILHNLITTILEDILIDRTDVDLDYDFMSEKEFDEIAVGLGLQKESEENNDSGEESDSKEGLKVYLKGHFVIDPVYGKLVQELEIGDLVYAQINDNSEVGISIGRLIGAYRMGLWRPVRCKINEITKLTGERFKVSLKIARGIFIDVLSFEDILVRTNSLTKNPPSKKTPVEDISTVSFVPLLIAVVIAVVLILLLVALT